MSSHRRFGPIADSYELTWEGKLRSMASDVTTTIDAITRGDLDGISPFDALERLRQRIERSVQHDYP